MKRCTLLLLFCLAAGCFRDAGHRTAHASTSHIAEGTCVRNLAGIRHELQSWNLNGPIPPTSLDGLAQAITNASTFVCPASGHLPGSLTNIEDWTDYIYFDLGHRF